MKAATLRKQIGMTNRQLWEDAEQLGCPHMRQILTPWANNHERPSVWLALNRDPCPACKHLTCNNVGLTVREPRRTVILHIRRRGRRNERMAGTRNV